MPTNWIGCLRFATDTRGGVAPIFSLLLIPLVAFAGGAIDLATAVSMRSKMQHALDAATVIAMQNYRNTGDASRAQALLKQQLIDNLAAQGLRLHDESQSETQDNEFVLSGLQINAANGTLEPQLTARIPTRFLKILHFENMDISVSSGTALPARKVDVGIMLDITGSMCDAPATTCSSGHKLDALKRAVKHFLGIVLATGDGQNQVAIVPFSSAVNVGDYVKAATGQTSDTRTVPYQCYGGKTCTKTYYLTQCVTERDGTGSRNNNLPGDDKYFTPVWSQKSASDCTPGDANKILPLTTDLQTLKAHVDGLTAKGGTGGHLGAQWTWAAISHSWAGFWGPAHAPRAPGGDVKKIAILMTDGDMTLHNLDNGPNCQGSLGSNGQDCARSRKDLLAICAGMKAEGITVYTIGYAPQGKGISTTGKQMLQECASPGKAFLPYSEESMERDFRNIGKDVSGAIALTR